MVRVSSVKGVDVRDGKWGCARDLYTGFGKLAISSFWKRPYSGVPAQQTRTFACGHNSA